MRRGRHAREPEVDPFYDMLFNMLIAFVFCFIVALLAMNPKALPQVSPEFRETADPRNLDNAIAQTEPDDPEAYERAWQEVQAQ